MMKDDVRMPIGTQSPDSLLASQLAEAVNAVAPQAITDGKVDLERLKHALGEHVETGRERYGLTWPGKAEAIKAAQRPSLGTLRPKAGEGINEESTGNLIIEGDNLEVLKLLQKAYLGKIKMIYIDPPYNTGNDFVYEDNFADPLAGYLEQTGQTVDGKRLSTNTETAGRYHSNWLSMMYPRLTLARNLLREDGVIFISIDDNEVANLRKICDEVFGEQNFVANVVWQKKYSPANDAQNFSPMHDHILVYARTFRNSAGSGTGFIRDLLPRTAEQDSVYTNRDNDPRGLWRSDNLSINTYSAAYDYPITTPSGRIVSPQKGACWRVSKAKFAEMLADNRIWFGEKGDGVPSIKRFLSEVQQGRVPTTWWTYEECGHNQDAQRDLAKLFTEKDPGFDTPKPVKLIRHMLTISAKSDPSALILDFFAGSGTTAQAVLEMNEEDGGNRKFILVQLPEVVDEDSAAAKAGFANIVEITKERVRRVIKKLDGGTKDGLGLDGTKNLDRGFKVYALDRSNFVPWDATAATDAASLEQQLELAVDNVVHGRSHADLLAEILLKTGFPLETPITTVTIAGTDVYQVADPGFLVCLAEKVDAPLIKAIAATKPHRVVILDAAFQGNDALKTNAVQAFKDQGVEMFRTA
jgi:adenine-specific DNA-methyltransferase